MLTHKDTFLIQDTKLEKKIWDTIFSTANIYKDFERVEHFILTEGKKFYQSEDQIKAFSNSLSSGYSGICLLLGELDQVNPEGGWDLVALEYLKCIQKYMQGENFIPISLFEGMSGIIMGANSCSRNGTRYQKFLKQLNTFLLDVYPSFLQDSLSRIGKNVRMEDYDVIGGWSGIGRSLLSFSNYPETEKALKDILNYAVHLSRQTEINNHLVPSWYIPKENLFLSQEKLSNPNGNFNCGVAHGIPGVLAFLSIATKHQVIVPGQLEAIERITSWLIQWIQTYQGIVFMPNTITWDDSVSNKYTQGFQHRDAWCYGSPGVARTIWLAGDACQREDWKRQALSLFKSTFQRSKELWRVTSPTFCHGYAGLLSLTQEMWRESGDKTLEINRNKLIEDILACFDPEAPFHFYDHDLNFAREQIEDNTKVGLLEGTSGIILSLLSTVHAGGRWQQAFLIK